MRIALVVLVALPATASVASVKQRPRERERCEILEAGYYKALQRTEHADDGSPTGDRYESDDVEFTSQTRTIARTLDRSFGFRYRLNLPANQDVEITTKITYPRPLNGKRVWQHPQTWSTGNGALTQHMGYTFEYAWETVPGAWKMEVLVDNKPACLVVFAVK